MERHALLVHVARELLYSTSNNGWGIRAAAVSAACTKYQVEFKDLWPAVIQEAAYQEEED